MKFTSLAKFASTILEVILAGRLIRPYWEKRLVWVQRRLDTAYGMMVLARISIFASSCAEEVSAIGLSDALGILRHLDGLWMDFCVK